MRWMHHCDRELTEAIVACFRDGAVASARRFAPIDASAWRRSEFWLDTSGLALYLAEQLHALGITEFIDRDALALLERKLADNRARTADMMQEFLALNRAFSAGGICYANLKGFTLAPSSCSDLSLRHQSDFDFLVDPADLPQARTLLEERGYRITGETSRTLEFKSGNTQTISLEGHYKTKPVRAVELHLSMNSHDPRSRTESRDERLDRRIAWSCGHEEFPALSGPDQFVGQALHLLGHLRGEHTRPSWLLEFRRHALYRQNDAAFWQHVDELVRDRQEAGVAIGLSVFLSSELFSPFPDIGLSGRLQAALPPPVRLWAERYGRQAVMAEVPGTKLYHLLESAMARSSPTPTRSRAPRRLLPFHVPPRILRAPKHDTAWLRLRREWIQLQYIVYRAAFHAREALRIGFESRRWRIALQRIDEAPPQDVCPQVLPRRAQ